MEEAFRDREEAGRLLGRRCLEFRPQKPIVLAMVRGGVPVAYEVARALEAPLDVVVVRKVGTPWQPELALGAVANGNQPVLVWNEEIVGELGLTPEALDRLAGAKLHEVRERTTRYRGGRAPLAILGRTVILVDDGIATGASIRAAIRAIRRAGPERLVLAVPVAPPDTLASLRPEVDDLRCLLTPAHFGAVGSFYDSFPQTTDEEVQDLLARAGDPGWTESP